MRLNAILVHLRRLLEILDRNGMKYHKMHCEPCASFQYQISAEFNPNIPLGHPVNPIKQTCSKYPVVKLGQFQRTPLPIDQGMKLAIKIKQSPHIAVGLIHK